MKFKIILLMIALSCFAFNGFSQGRDLMKMLEEEKAGGNDTVHVNLLISICDSLYRTKPSDAILFGTKALDISKDLKFRKGEAYSLKYIGMGHYVQGLYQPAIDYFFRSKDLFVGINNKKGAANLLNNIGAMYQNIGENVKAADFYHQSLELSDEIKDSVRIVAASINLGLIYSMKKATWSLAKDYYNRALEICQITGNIEGIEVSNTNLGELLSSEGKYDEALKYFENTINLSKDKYSTYIPNALISIGILYSKKGDYPDAIKYLEKALKTAQESNSKYESVMTLIELAKTYKLLGDPERSLNFYRQAEKTAAEMGRDNELKKIYGGIAHIFSEKKDYEDAYRYKLMESAIKDSLFSNMIENQINQFQIQHMIEADNTKRDIEKTSIQMTLIKAKNRMQILVIILLILGVASISVFMTFLIRSNNKRKLINEELNTSFNIVSSQKKEIESSHKEITASITYAKEIQSAVLPKRDQLEKCLGEYFIFHKPKEVVSGDFYWATVLKNNTIVAAVDCTGHGVPGALMSMLGSAFLNEIINKENIVNPNEVLFRLREEVIRTMQQRGEQKEMKDGMDISLCKIDYESMKLKFAGANNPLYLIRDSDLPELNSQNKLSEGQFTLYETKGDKMPIGFYDTMDKFTLFEIDLLEGDLLYMFTDGFADQVGGPDRKKYKYDNFKKLLLKHCTKSMEQQKRIIENELEHWQGNFSQVDDILVLGIKIK